jgi:hypothetical protein
VNLIIIGIIKKCYEIICIFFSSRDRRRKLHREWAVFFFSFCCQGQEEEVTQGMGT